MKRICLVLLAALCALSLTGCATIGVLIGQNATTMPSPTAAPTPTASPAPTALPEPTAEPTPEPTDAPASVDDYVGLLTQEHIAYTDGVGNTYDVTYTVPKLLLNSGDAAQVNREIEELCLPEIAYAQQSAEAGTSLILMNISYQAWLENNNLTLILALDYDADSAYYTVYRLCVNSGALLTNEDMAAQLGIGDAEYSGFVRNAMEAHFASMYSGAKEAVGEEFYLAQLENTVSDDNVQAAELYFDADGTPMLHCRIYSLAGASWYEYLIPLFP